MQRQFLGVWILAEIWLDKRLNLVAKAMYAEIESFGSNGKTFHKSNDTIQSEYGVSRPTISKTIKQLVDLGLIGIRFDGRVRHLYVQADRKKFTGRPKESFGQGEKMFRAAGKNDTYTNTEKRTKKKTTKIEVVLPWDSESFSEAWQVWIDERKERGTKKYTARGEQTALHKLQKDSQGDEAVAIQMIHQSIAHGWQGLFPLKNQHNAKQQRGAADGSIIEAHLRKLANDTGSGMG